MKYFTLHKAINEYGNNLTHCTLDICRHKRHNKAGHGQGYSATHVARR